MKRWVINWIVILIITLNTCCAEELKSEFFFKPELISEEELGTQQDSQLVAMCWQFDPDVLFYFCRMKNETYLEIFYDKSSKYVTNCGVEIGNRYSIFSYEKKDGELSIIGQPRSNIENVGPNTVSYLVEQRRFFEHPLPQVMKESELVSIISNQNVLFYTGAGVSVAAGIPSMEQLEDSLKVYKGSFYLLFLKEIMEFPDRFAERIGNFYNACFYSQPTKAHEALKELTLYKKTRLVTENIDCLHERTGVLPYRVNADQLRSEIGNSELSQIDYIICVGLSYDDKGFLGWYKRHYPQGKIIAVDLGSPSYLGEEDFIIRADLQELLPSLAKKVLGNVSN